MSEQPGAGVADAAPSAGGLLELETGNIAAGGGCVARAPDGRVVFVRHALPGELVRALVTQETKSFLRADAIEILRAAPERVVPPCGYAGPGGCGGCDWQHVSLPEQRRLKAALVTEQLHRLAGLDMEVEVEELPGAPDGLGWRTRVRFGVSDAGVVGLRRHRSHEIEPIDRCLIAAPGVEALDAEDRDWPGVAEFEVFTSSDTGETLVDVVSAKRKVGEVPNLDAGFVVDHKSVRSPTKVHIGVLGRMYQVSAGVFWQVHPAAAAVLTTAVLEGLDPKKGETALDLYAGAGLFAAQLGVAVGKTGAVVSIERDVHACEDARANTEDLPWVQVDVASITSRMIRERLGAPDLLVVDPAREGVGIEAMEALLELRPRPRRLAYVACDPASFARDLRVALDDGWTISSLRCFDLFPMTEHVEIVAILSHAE
ncbi:MAG TPA: TRAM domain-containing protein [Acidimicrobiales bacterium]